MTLARRKPPATELTPQEVMALASGHADDIEREYCERRLSNYVQRAWHVLEPKTDFSRGAIWYLEAICDHLEALLPRVEDKDADILRYLPPEIQNLLINIPGRMGKSLTSVVFFPSWVWGPKHMAWFRFIFGSYSAYLSRRDSRATRRLIMSVWYQRLWGDEFSLLGDQNAIERFDNTESGYRIATSVGGAGTGEGGNLISVDDPHNVKQAESDSKRKEAITWWDETMGDRLNDPKTGSRLITAHRTHAHDLSNHVLEKGGYVHLCLPMEYDPKRTCYTKVKPYRANREEVPTKVDEDGTVLYRQDPRTEENELMDENRVGPKQVADLKTALGSYAWPARLNQRASLREGGMIKLGWFGRYRTPKEEYDQIVQSWDTANKKGQQNAWTVGLTFGRIEKRSDLLSVFRRRLNIPDVQRSIQNLADTPWGRANAILIENAASGIGIIQHLQENTDLPILSVNPVNDKITRMDVETPAIEAGNIWLPEFAEWLVEFENEMRDFPGCNYLDQGDALSQYLHWIRMRYGENDWDMY